MRTRLASVWAFYWFYYGASAVVVPFLALYLSRNGLSPTGIGITMAVQSLAAIIAAPLLGGMDDRNDADKKLLTRLLVILSGVGVILVFHPPLYAILILTGVFAVADAGAAPLADKLALSVIRETGTGSYGGTRVFGSLGWICMAPLAGFLVDKFTIDTLFTGFVVLVLPAAYLAGSAGKSVTGKPVSSGAGMTVCGSPGSVLRHRQLLRSIAPAIVALLLHQFFARSLFRFEPLYLESLGVSTAIIGITVSIPALVELGGMPLAGLLESRVGPWRVVRIGITLFAVRMALVRLWPTVPMIIVSKILDGFEFAFVLVGTVGLITAESKGEPPATLLALVTVSLQQAVQLISLPVSGIVFERFGGVHLYTLAGLSSTTAIMVLLRRTGPKQ